MTIRRNPGNGRREILIDGNVFPTFTRGDVEVNPVVSWPEEPRPDGSADPVVVGYEVTVKCFVPNLQIQDPDVLKEIPLETAVPDPEDRGKYI